MKFLQSQRLSSYPGQSADHRRACPRRIHLARAGPDRRADRHRRHLPPPGSRRRSGRPGDFRGRQGSVAAARNRQRRCRPSGRGSRPPVCPGPLHQDRGDAAANSSDRGVVNLSGAHRHFRHKQGWRIHPRGGTRGRRRRESACEHVDEVRGNGDFRDGLGDCPAAHYEAGRAATVIASHRMTPWPSVGEPASFRESREQLSRDCAPAAM